MQGRKEDCFKDGLITFALSSCIDNTLLFSRRFFREDGAREDSFHRSLLKMSCKEESTDFVELHASNNG